MRSARRHTVVRFVVPSRAVLVRCTFRILFVEHAMGMNRIWIVTVIAEDHLDRVADFGMDHRSEKTEVIPFGRSWLQRFEGAVGVLAINRLYVLCADRLRHA